MVSPLYHAVVIGASAGAIDALRDVLPKLPETFPWPVIVVVHLPPNRPSLLPAIFSPIARLTVREPVDKEPILPRTIYFAPPDYHLLVEDDRSFSLSLDAPVRFSRPSVDVLFESAADTFGAGVVAVVLTGANDDGGDGVAAVEANGGRVIVQDPNTAESREMPLTALARAHSVFSGSPSRIGEFLASLPSSTYRAEDQP